MSEINVLEQAASCPYIVNLLDVSRSPEGDSELIYELGVSLHQRIHGEVGGLTPADARLMTQHLSRGRSQDALSWFLLK